MNEMSFSISQAGALIHQFFFKKTLVSGTGATAPPLGPGNQYKPYSTQNAHSASYVAVALDSRAPLSRGVFRPGPVGRGALPEKNRFSAQVLGRPPWAPGISTNPTELKTLIRRATLE